ncbi:hypothetical protein Pmar_PMAR011144 [Perkinsus marinus ATCC 50983]|uniref:Uncharacterized protein n=1 Tax=Perkinsus marinus (strain ATCC 50983 / TXsc) TaxID=423536 RepID=C5KAF0_PERM5|nr:hypothetical protein Pmar_PMAR011144 [Perkinsus marinus ATCC 50983]EER18543.1 hypothetical protein Pmar_PMAR011144 [Perkinsus marinus ATCC 50983]|eukprot:XP_002786747.1 hypothetical protein Pmar_PMAR011144 [Perkinsus marinus ATCC 50983]
MKSVFQLVLIITALTLLSHAVKDDVERRLEQILQPRILMHNPCDKCPHTCVCPATIDPAPFCYCPHDK